jgi:hypothetical protein
MRLGLSFSILVFVASHDRSVREPVIALVEEGGKVLALQVDGMVSQGPRQEHGYRNTGRMDKLEGAE